jgi:ketosteroid isomerase-like protein
MSPDNSNSPDPEKDKPVDPQQIEELFQRLPANLRWPKPNAEALAAAVEAIQRMSGGSSAAQDLAAAAVADEHHADELGNACSACGTPLAPAARFCAACGTPAQAAGDLTAQSRAAAGHHHVHHHYHHFVPSHETPSATPSGESGPVVPRGRAPGAPGSSGGRAEASARQVVQDWAQACNTRHIDDLLDLYAADATLIRSSVPPVRSLPAIREFLASLLEAGLGDVEMESLRLEVMGEIALDLGRCKMLVPVAMGKRREERGKYLVVLVRQPAGTWKILADCWSADLAVGAPPSDAAARRGNEQAPPQRKPR